MSFTPQIKIQYYNLEGSVLLSCADTFSLGLFQDTDKLNIRLPSGAKLISSQVDRCEVHTINDETDSIPPFGNLSQSNIDTQIVHAKQDLERLLPNCFQALGRFQEEPYHIEANPSVQFKRHCVPVQAAFKQQLAETQVVGTIKPFDHATSWINSFVIVN